MFESLATFLSGLVVKGEAIFEQALTVLGNVTFRGKVTVSTDTAGVAVIPQLSQQVDVPFERPYESPPIVTISLALKESTDSAFLADGAKAAVSNVTVTGFRIVLDAPVPRDLEYNWFALGLTGGRRVVGKRLDGGSVAGTADDPVIREKVREIPLPSIFTPTPAIPLLTPTPTAGTQPSPLVNPAADSISSASGIVVSDVRITPPPTVIVMPNEFGFVRLRKNGSVDGEEIARILPGTILPYLGEAYGWYSVRYNGQTGWVSGALVQLNL